MAEPNKKEKSQSKLLKSIGKNVVNALDKKMKYRSVLKESPKMTVVIPKHEPYYKSLYMKNQWENEKKSFLMK